jgi:mannose-1-phosphate guanylyltransferase
VLGHVDTGYWLDVGTPEAFFCGSRDLVMGELASTVLPARAARSWCCPA